MPNDLNQKISISLPAETIRYAEQYQREHDLSSRSEVVLEAVRDHAAERPHMSRWNRYVITCWDQVVAEAFVGWYMRIDMLEGAP